MVKKSLCCTPARRAKSSTPPVGVQLEVKLRMSCSNRGAQWGSQGLSKGLQELVGSGALRSARDRRGRGDVSGSMVLLLRQGKPRCLHPRSVGVLAQEAAPRGCL